MSANHVEIENSDKIEEVLNKEGFQEEEIRGNSANNSPFPKSPRSPKYEKPKIVAAKLNKYSNSSEMNLPALSKHLAKEKFEFLRSMKSIMKENAKIASKYGNKAKEEVKKCERKNKFLPPLDGAEDPLHKDINWVVDVHNKQDIEGAYDHIHHKMKSVDEKVGKALKKNQNGFLDWYYGKWYNLQRKIQLLKEDANMNSINKKIKQDLLNLQTQLHSFSDEAEKLESLCRTHLGKLNRLKHINLRAQEENQFLHDQIQYAHTNNNKLIQKIGVLEDEIGRIGKMNMEIIEGEYKEDSEIKESSNINSQDKEMNEESAIEPTIPQYIPTQADYEGENALRILQNQIKYLQRKYATMKKMNAMPGKRPYLIRELNSFEETLMESIKTVRGGIAKRRCKTNRSISMSKFSTSRSQPSLNLHHQYPSIMEENIQKSSIPQFTETDKLLVLEGFLKNENVLKFIFEKMFPGAGELLTEPTEEVVNNESNTINKQQFNSSYPCTLQAYIYGCGSLIHNKIIKEGLYRNIYFNIQECVNFQLYQLFITICIIYK